MSKKPPFLLSKTTLLFSFYFKNLSSAKKAGVSNYITAENPLSFIITGLSCLARCGNLCARIKRAFIE
jgi:hypothetical protein